MTSTKTIGEEKTRGDNQKFVVDISCFQIKIF